MMKSKKAMFFSPFLVLIFVILTLSAFVILDKKYETLSKSKTLGEKQMDLFDAYAKGEKAMFYIDRAAEIAAEEAVYGLGESGVSTGCDILYDESGSYVLWQEYDTECYPSNKDALEAYNGIFDLHMSGYLQKYSDEDVRMPYSFTLNLKDTELTGTSNEDLVVGLGKIPILSQVGFSSGLCHYCRETKKMFGLDCEETCCAAPCPEGSTVLNIPHLNQCGYTPQTACYGRTICSSGCGPTSTTMAINYLLGVDKELVPIYKVMCGDLMVYQPGGSVQSLVASQPRELGLKTKLKTGITWGEVNEQLSKNNPIVIFQQQRGTTCTSRSNVKYRCGCAGGHIVLIVGVSDDFVMLNEPYTGSGRSDCKFEFGDHMVVPKSSFDKAWAARSRAGIIISEDDDI